MHQLTRRLALGLTLPLALAAPVVLLAAPAHATGFEVSVVKSVPSPAVYGSVVTATATVMNGTSPVTTGTVQFQISAPVVEATNLGGPVPISAAGTAVSPTLVQSDGHPLDITTVSNDWQITAIYFDPVQQPNGSGSTSLAITKAGSSVAVLPTATTVVADLAGAPPGGALPSSLKPTGTVTFTVNGAPGTARPVADGQATLDFLLGSGAQTVSAAYSGDTRYTASSATFTRRDPLLGARVLSSFPQSKSGWYNSAVDIVFICRPQGSELVEDCPGDVTLKKSGKDQSVTRSIHAVDGGAATVTVKGIDIDRDKPVITIDGRTCSATDKLSGVKGTCRMKIARNGHFTAVAQDKAGNRAVKRGVLD